MAAVAVVATATAHPAAAYAAGAHESHADRIADLIDGRARTLTLEGGFVGMQAFMRVTPLQLRGSLCAGPKTCSPVDYFALPVGWQTEAGAVKLNSAIGESGTDKTILLGHSQGGQVIYASLRSWADGRAEVPDGEVVWVSLGNPENPYGRRAGGIGYDHGQGLPDNYRDVVEKNPDIHGVEVIRQYDGWADYPQDTTNLLAVLNAQMGQFSIHNDYRDIDLTDENNATYYDAENQITYVWIPTKTMPLVSWAGPLAPTLDKMLRPTVEAGYNRPGDVQDQLADAYERDTGVGSAGSLESAGLADRGTTSASDSGELAELATDVAAGDKSPSLVQARTTLTKLAKQATPGRAVTDLGADGLKRQVRQASRQLKAVGVQIEDAGKRALAGVERVVQRLAAAPQKLQKAMNDAAQKSAGSESTGDD
ncbi:hypothetical protein MBRU_15415 [Mycolicibacterium brumae DSM 44177]|nr:hypothetical protein MBRU_15415 [Mycolicibacterium brumae DSM 44177]